MLVMHNKPALRVLLAHTRHAGETPAAASQRWLRTGLEAAAMSRAQVDRVADLYRTYCLRMRQLSTDSEAAMDALRAAQQVRAGAREPGMCAR